MAKQTINIGTVANDGTGTTLRAGGSIINDNFTELYNAKATTIGTGGDYATVGAAIASGASGNFQLLSNVTETGSTNKVDTTYPAFTILPTNYTWAFSVYSFQYRGVKNIHCNVTNPNFSYNGIDGVTNIFGSTVILSTVTSYYINLINCNVTVPNNSTVTYNNMNIVNSRITGSGASSRLTISGKIIGNSFLGTWSSTLLVLTSASPAITEFSGNNGGITGTIAANTGNPYILSNNLMENVTYQVTETGAGNLRDIFISNCHFAAYALSSGSTNHYFFSNCKFKTLATLPAHAANFSNCYFDASIVVPNSTLPYRFSNCRFAVNLTITAGANNAKFYGNTVVGTYTDNGTGTVNL